MPDLLKKISSFVVKILFLSCLLLLLAAPAWAAEEQTPKDQVTPPKETPQPGLPTMSPRPATKAYKSEAEGSRKLQEESLEHKKVTGTVGGQEIRAKEGQEDK